jgi:hypothetical protein
MRTGAVKDAALGFRTGLSAQALGVAESMIDDGDDRRAAGRGATVV